MSAVFFGTILLEPNRWTPDKHSSVAVSAWASRIKAAGFDGLELWENHMLEADEGERCALRSGPLRVAVFNAYVRFDAAGAARRALVADAIREVGAAAVKFNLGSDAARRAEECRVAQDWFAGMPGVVPLCECHAGTNVDTCETADAAFRDWPEVGMIVHPFAIPADVLTGWLRHFGRRVCHAHVQSRDAGGRWLRLRQSPDDVRRTVEVLRAHDYRGSFTVEFTEGVNVKPEDAELIFRNAREDRETLREWWGA